MGWYDENFFNTGMIHFGGYDISASTSEASPQKKGFSVGKPQRAIAAVPERKPAVRVGSLPNIPAWLLHLVLAIAAAGLVHLVIHFCL